MSASINPDSGIGNNPFSNVSGPDVTGHHSTMSGPGFDPEPPKGEKESGATASQIPDRLAEVGGALGKLARTLWKEGKAGAKEAGTLLAEDANRFGTAVMERIAVKTSEQKSTVREIVKILPGVGPTTRYADAWRKWNEGTAANDEAKLQQARKECILALADAGVDIAFLGAGKLAVGAARAVRAVGAQMAFTRAIRNIGPGLDPIDTLAGHVAQSSPGKRIAEYLLKSIRPTQDADEIAKGAEKTESDLDAIVDEEALAAEAEAAGQEGEGATGEKSEKRE